MKKVVVFTAGLPGSGKSTVIKKSEYSNFRILDCDDIKKSHPDYNPKNPSLLHAWSKSELKKLVNNALTKDDNVVLDTTGTNVNRMLTEINMFKKAGFETVLVFVSVSLQTAIYRNAKRERTVPKDIIQSKHEVIHSCMSTLREHVDVYKVIHND